MRDAHRQAPADDEVTVSEQGASFAGKQGRGWAWLAGWVVPLMMAGAYAVLISTSEVGVSGALWESGGFLLVLVFWIAFRTLTRRAALARAISVGDDARLLELARDPVDRAIAYEIRRDWPNALHTLDGFTPTTSERQVIAAAVRIHALCETGDVARAREILDREVDPRAAQLDRRLHATGYDRALLAKGRVLAAEGHTAEAHAVLTKLADDVRADPNLRAEATRLRSSGQTQTQTQN